MKKYWFQLLGVALVVSLSFALAGCQPKDASVDAQNNPNLPQVPPSSRGEGGGVATGSPMGDREKGIGAPSR